MRETEQHRELAFVVNAAYRDRQHARQGGMSERCGPQTWTCAAGKGSDRHMQRARVQSAIEQCSRRLCRWYRDTHSNPIALREGASE